MICFPNAKINLGLKVTEKRGDGYHNLESVFYPVGLCDVLEAVEAGQNGPDISFTASGISIPGSPSDNLCFKALELLRRDHFIPGVAVHLHKVIPMGAGLGGGSSDAVAFIKLLDKKFDLNLSWGEQHHYARQLGSDCSFFVGNQPSFAKGRGDDQEKLGLDLAGYHLAIVHPGIHVSTKEAYAGVNPAAPSRDLKQDIFLPVKEWKGIIGNDFEEHVFEQHPRVREVKEKLYALGAVYASMSGSGSAVYGIFERATALANDFPGYFVWEGKM
jgi:4-diphosphocytidyl-2-C-methyl-D-erythritol kinase